MVSTDANNVYFTIGRKTAEDLGLTRAQGAAWDAIYATAQNDDSLTDSLLDVTDNIQPAHRAASRSEGRGGRDVA